MTTMRRAFHFSGGGLPPDTLEVVSFEGNEAISSLFRFEVTLVSKKVDIDFTAMLQKPALLALKQGVKLKGSDKRGIKTLKLHGVLSSFEQEEQGLDWVTYRAVLVPDLWRLSLNIQSQIYMDKTVPEIVEEELKGAGFTTNDYEFRTHSRKYPKREYVVQYLESDFSFISRLCEHEGIFYYFEHTEDAAKIIFGDAPESCVPIQGTGIVSYKPISASRTRVEATDDERTGDDWFQEEVVQSLSFRQHMIPREVILKDYNYRKPSTDLKVSTLVVQEGYGTVYEFGNHYKDVDEGTVYAKLRAEERKCRQKFFVGTSDSRSFRAGATYTLSEHYRTDFNRKYLIAKIRHQGSQPIELATPSGTVPAYRNEFSSIPADVVFRPERVTPKPKVAGLLNARVDAGGDGKSAEIDDEGRYKVQLPFDLSGKSGGKASRYIRMAQPYAGGGMGMHFPLHKGTEVILGHVNGDPDRPIIAAAVPNPETGSPVKGGNQTQCAIHTGGGNKFTIEDGAGSERITMSTPHGNTKLSLGAPNSPDPGVWWQTALNWVTKVDGDHKDNIGGSEHREVGGHSIWVHHGNHAEKIFGLSEHLVFASEHWQIAGGETKIIGGLFLEIVFGAIVHTGWAFQIHRTAGPHKLESSVCDVHGKALVTIRSHGRIGASAPKVDVIGTAQLFLKSGASSGNFTPGSIVFNTPNFSSASTGPATITASGRLGLNGQNVFLDSTGAANIKSGSNLLIEGGAVATQADDITMNGSALRVTKSRVSAFGTTLEVRE